MKTSILNKLAFRSIFSHKQLYFPFLLAVSLLFSLEYILLSLMQNEYVLEFHFSEYALCRPQKRKFEPQHTDKAESCVYLGGTIVHRVTTHSCFGGLIQ